MALAGFSVFWVLHGDGDGEHVACNFCAAIKRCLFRFCKIETLIDGSVMSVSVICWSRGCFSLRGICLAEHLPSPWTPRRSLRFRARLMNLMSSSSTTVPPPPSPVVVGG